MLKQSLKIYNNNNYYYRLRQSCNCNCKSSIATIRTFSSQIRPTTTTKAISKESLHRQKTKWKSVVGLEIHAQIDTKSKLFSGAGINFNSTVNSCVSLFDAAIPGTLPVLNRNCVIAAVKTAIALSCRINAISMFDRKHYFYADLPAGYQITQQRAALANAGELIFPVFVPGIHNNNNKPYNKRVRLHQLQLEQDSGKSLHDLENKKSLVDLNRAGIPLMELVFDPDLEDGEEAAALVKELILIFKRLKTCSCKMEEGALRVDANVSIHRPGEPFGVRTEIKNIGSVRAVAQAITYEIQRQIDIMDSGGGGGDAPTGVIQNETRSWDALRKCTIAMRDKEIQQDYRFMPEPNLPPLHLRIGDDDDHAALQNNLNIINVNEITIPELPEMTRRNLIRKFGLTEEIAIILVREDILMEYFLAIIDKNPKIQPKTITNLLINDLLTMCHKHKIEIEDCKIHPIQMVELIEMLECGEIHLKMARLIIQELLLNVNNYHGDDNGKFPSPKVIANVNNWKQISDKNQIESVCRMVISRNPKMIDEYQKGKIKLLFALAGECARETDNKANMSMVVMKLKELLNKKSRTAERKPNEEE